LAIKIISPSIKPKIHSEPRLGEILISRQQIKSRVKELAAEINRDYYQKNLLVVGILKGASIFMADLIRHIKVDVQFDYMAVSSYGAATKTSGTVRMLKDLDENISGHHVLLVEDIIDSGLTLSYLVKNLKSRGPASLEICSLLRKKGKQRLTIKARYTGFSIGNEFVVGYGLDFHQKYRHLRDIRILQNPPTGNGY